MQQDVFRSILKRQPRKLDDTRILRHVAIDVGLWTLMIFAHDIAFGVISAALFAVFTFRSFGQLHEAVHGATATERSRNNKLGELYGIFCFLPFKSWQELHLNHHQWTGNVDKDPSMKILARFEQNQFRIAGLVGGSWLYWIPLLGFMQHLVFWAPAVRSKNYAFAVGAPIYLAFSMLTLGPWTLILGLVAYLYMVEVINFPHHLDLPQQKGDARFTPLEQNQFDRSCI